MLARTISLFRKFSKLERTCPVIIHTTQLSGNDVFFLISPCGGSAAVTDVQTFKCMQIMFFLSNQIVTCPVNQSDHVDVAAPNCTACCQLIDNSFKMSTTHAPSIQQAAKRFFSSKRNQQENSLLLQYRQLAIGASLSRLTHTALHRET